MSIASRHVRAPRRTAPTVEQTVESRMLEERTRWAMHVHDGLTQSVTSVILELHGLRGRILSDPALALATLEELEVAIRTDLSRIRAILFELEEGSPRAEPTLSAFVEELVDRWKLPARVSVEGDFDDAPVAVLEAAHAVIGEALANAAKHSGSPDVAVRVRAHDGAIRIEVEDRGSGLRNIEDEDPHFGLRLMRARAEDIGGTIEIESTPGGGTRVVALLPVEGRGDTR